jgi:hypothetical protein
MRQLVSIGPDGLPVPPLRGGFDRLATAPAAGSAHRPAQPNPDLRRLPAPQREPRRAQRPKSVLPPGGSPRPRPQVPVCPARRASPPQRPPGPPRDGHARRVQRPTRRPAGYGPHLPPRCRSPRTSLRPRSTPPPAPGVRVCRDGKPTGPTPKPRRPTYRRGTTRPVATMAATNHRTDRRQRRPTTSAQMPARWVRSRPPCPRWHRRPPR